MKVLISRGPKSPGKGISFPEMEPLKFIKNWAYYPSHCTWILLIRYGDPRLE